MEVSCVGAATLAGARVGESCADVGGVSCAGLDEVGTQLFIRSQPRSLPYRIAGGRYWNLPFVATLFKRNGKPKKNRLKRTSCPGGSPGTPSAPARKCDSACACRRTHGCHMITTHPWHMWHGRSLAHPHAHAHAQTRAHMHVRPLAYGARTDRGSSAS